MTLCGNMVIADVFNVTVQMRSSGCRVGSEANDWCLYKKRGGLRGTQGRGLGKMEAEIGVTLPQVKESQGLPETTRNKEEARKNPSLD